MSTLKGKSVSSTYKNLIQTSSEVSDTSLKRVETGAGNATSMSLSTDKAEFLKVGIGTGGNTPDGLLHVVSVSAGSVTSSVFANTLTLENSTDSGLSILSGASSSGNIYFGDANDNDVGKIVYSHSDNNMSFSTNGSEKMRLDQNGNLTLSGVVSQSEDRFELTEYFEKAPSLQQATISQASSATTAVTLDAKYGVIIMQSVNLAANDSVKFPFNNAHIFGPSSHVLVQLSLAGSTITDNGMVNVSVETVADGSCVIRLSTNGVDVAANVYKLSFIVDPFITPNQNFVLSGVSAGGSQISGNVGRDAFFAGVKMVTGTSDNDKTILGVRNGNTEMPQGFDSSAWASVPFKTQNKIEFNAAISTGGVITTSSIWSGLKLTSTGGYVTDANQAYFLYATDDNLGGNNANPLTTNGNLHFVYSVAGTDYITNLGIIVTLSTVYKLRISFDENRQISVFVNNVRYGLVTSATAGGALQPVATTKSLAMANDISLLPFIGCQTLTTASRGMQVGYVKLSRTLYL